jgi:hypothetical protein
VNWRAFAAGAAFAALVALIVGGVILVVDPSDDASLGAVTLPPATTTIVEEVSVAVTVPAVSVLPLDSAALLADPCVVLTQDLLDAIAVDERVRPDGDHGCVAGDGPGAVDVEVVPDDGAPGTAAVQFQRQYGVTSEPLAGLGLGLQVRQGNRTLVAVFGPDAHVLLSLPTSDVDVALATTIRSALVEPRPRNG